MNESSSGGGVIAGRHLPPLDEVEITSDIVVTVSSLDAGSRDFGSLKRAVPKFDGSSADFPLWKRRFEEFAAMSCCVPYFRSVTDTEVGDSSIATEFQLTQGFRAASINKARIVWDCLLESINDKELLGRQ